MNPEVGVMVYFQDEHGRACRAKDAYMWTWAGADKWIRVRDFKVPVIAGKGDDGCGVLMEELTLGKSGIIE